MIPGGINAENNISFKDLLDRLTPRSDGYPLIEYSKYSEMFIDYLTRDDNGFFECEKSEVKSYLFTDNAEKTLKVLHDVVSGGRSGPIKYGKKF